MPEEERKEKMLGRNAARASRTEKEVLKARHRKRDRKK